MMRSSRRSDIQPGASRPVPPLPHPSWTYGTNQRPAAAGRLEPKEFWKRLGL